MFSGNASRKDIGDDFASVLKSCPNLRHLDLSYSGLGDEDMKAVMEALKFVPHLRLLNISGCKLSQNSMTYLSEKLSCTHELVSLSLENNNNIGAEGVKALTAGLHKVPRLESLSLHNVNRNTDSTRETSKVIYTSLGPAFAHCPRLTRLDLSANLLHQGTFIVECIKNAPKLTSLDLSGNAFQDGGAESLAKVLPCLKMLSELFLDRNRITCHGLLCLSEGLKLTPNLRKLSLKSNLISDVGTEALASVFPNLCQLCELYLGYNSITEAGVNALCLSSKSLGNLQCLDLKGNLINEEGMAAVNELLALLPKLRQLYLWSPVTESPQGQAAESGKPVALFSPTRIYSPGTCTGKERAPNCRLQISVIGVFSLFLS